MKVEDINITNSKSRTSKILWASISQSITIFFGIYECFHCSSGFEMKMIEGIYQHVINLYCECVMSSVM